MVSKFLLRQLFCRRHMGRLQKQPNILNFPHVETHCSGDSKRYFRSPTFHWKSFFERSIHSKCLRFRLFRQNSSSARMPGACFQIWHFSILKRTFHQKFDHDFFRHLWQLQGSFGRGVIEKSLHFYSMCLKPMRLKMPENAFGVESFGYWNSYCSIFTSLFSFILVLMDSLFLENDSNKWICFLYWDRGSPETPKNGFIYELYWYQSQFVTKPLAWFLPTSFPSRLFSFGAVFDWSSFAFFPFGVKILTISRNF